jgi:hypothetical protein
MCVQYPILAELPSRRVRLCSLLSHGIAQSAHLLASANRSCCHKIQTAHLAGLQRSVVMFL